MLQSFHLGDPVGILRLALIALAVLVAPARALAELDPEQWLQEAEAAYESVTTYTAVFHKQQRIEGELLPEETILLKARKEPFSLYMSWIEEPHKGSALLYVADWNEGQVRAHRGGILRFITRNLDPRAPALMKNNLRPVTSIGLGFLLDRIANDARTAMEADELTLTERGEETVYGRKTRVVEVIFPKETENQYEGGRYVINQDLESKIPLRIRIYDRDDRLVEAYGYEDIVLNAPLDDTDFNPENPEYHF